MADCIKNALQYLTEASAVVISNNNSTDLVIFTLLSNDPLSFLSLKTYSGQRRTLPPPYLYCNIQNNRKCYKILFCYSAVVSESAMTKAKTAMSHTLVTNTPRGSILLEGVVDITKTRHLKTGICIQCCNIIG